MQTTTSERQPQAYMHPVLAGIGLGLVLLATFVLVGRGLGASGAFNSVIARAVSAVAPEHAKGIEFMAGSLRDDGASPLKSWLVFEVQALFACAMLSGFLGDRMKVVTEKGPRVSMRTRLGMAFASGMLMPFGAALARGCTSGQALTGGALLNLGSWAFMLMVCGLGLFAGMFAFAELFPWLKGFYEFGAGEAITIPEALGLSRGIVVGAVVLMAVAGLYGATRIEKKFAVPNAE